MTPTDNDADSTIDPWLTVAEFADAMRVRPVTVRSWITKGELAATRSGRRKWLTRSSEVARRLEGDKAETAPAEWSVSRRPEAEQPAAETWTAPSFPPPVGTRESVKKLLEYASESIGTAFRASALATPSAGYVDRLRAIADGFEHFASTSIHAGNTAGTKWGGNHPWGPDRLPYEVRPGGNRPIRAGLWDSFDSAFTALGVAMAGQDIVAVGLAFRKAADELLAVADQLAREDGRRADSSVI